MAAEGGGGVHTVCGLDIGSGWCVEMCDDFDKHCSLSQKRLIQGNIRIC